MKKPEKAIFIQNMTKELKGAKSSYLVNYAGLGVAKQRELKKRLKAADGRLIVVKNTLFALAGKEAKYPEEILDDNVLNGQNALVLADGDPITPLKVVADFVKEFESTAGKPFPHIKVGVIEGLFADNETLINLASLGGKDAVIAQLIGMLMSPTYQTVSALEGKMQELIYVINAKAR
ncbi:50S ribosomal protein L10 [Candidatus Woesebacteria bacterium GWB1_43_5]|uniref:Large ribosomal subunit protein uL10 n=1 Tax=Candidatus Woesebacteria bacterium GWB1_43_5 TaxID=1802474 RepID=A0A1F7WRE0_9BACT|nr:MAG: 50S ribosomal protein L10 [Candidatus Woesebacteria bacterium GWB1_43_5]